MVGIIFDIETNGLNPHIDRILAIACLPSQEFALTQTKPQVFTGQSEAQLLQDFFTYLQSQGESQPTESPLLHFPSSPPLSLIGYNTLEFDLNFIIARAVIQAVKIPPEFLRATHIDLRRVIHRFRPTYGKLRELALGIGLTPKTFDGSQMPLLFSQGKWDEIKAHGAEDVLITKAVYERCIEVGLIEALPFPPTPVIPPLPKPPLTENLSVSPQNAT